MKRESLQSKRLKAVQKLDTPPIVLAIIGIIIWPYWLLGSLIFIPLSYTFTKNLKVTDELLGYGNSTIDKIYDTSRVYLGKSKILEESNNIKKSKKHKK